MQTRWDVTPLRREVAAPPIHTKDEDIMRTKTNRLLLSLVTLALIGVSACDLEEDRDAGTEDFALEDEREDAHQTDRDIPVAHLHEHDLGLTASTEPAQAGSATYVYSYDGVQVLGALTDGDVVMLKNFAEGYLQCDSNDEAKAKHDPISTNNYIWKLHLTDIDGDGTAELQFELIDSSGETGTYLKMSSDDEVYCGPITGIGDAAAWNLGGLYASLGSHYRKVNVELVNYKRDRCLKVNDSNEGLGANCTGTASVIFFLEIIASGA